MNLENAPSRKQGLRRQLSADRVIKTIGPVVTPGGVVAAYLPLPDEPDPSALLEQARIVLLPRMLEDRSLELVAWKPGDELVRSAVGTLEPLGPAIAVSEVDVVIAPALAVDPVTGIRLGRGGGSYDRLLAHVPRERRWAVLASESELIEGLPAEAHDQPVSRVILPGRMLMIGLG